MHIDNIRIGDMLFVHTEGKPELHRIAKRYFRQQIQAAVYKWREQTDATWCKTAEEGETIFFAVFRNGEFWGVWHFYKMRRSRMRRRHITNIAFGPAFPDLTEDEPDWRRIGRVIKWFVNNPMETDEGKLFIDNIRGPRVSEDEYDGYEFDDRKPQVVRFLDGLDSPHRKRGRIFDQIAGSNRTRLR